MTVTQEEFNDYIRALNQVMDWLDQEPCTDAISRQAVKDFYNNEFPTLDDGVHWSRNDIIQNLDSIPPVKPSEKVGRWDHGICNNCKYDWSKDAPIASVPKYCPACGCRMEKEDSNESI